ncbi:MAG: phosphoserine phosphatase SerB [Bacteroidetes bacterium]|nr:phosphoserine phosphatase SerB [Bacteroidota bacterium]
MHTMNELILASITGIDKPGLTSKITNLLARYDIRILDIGQSVIHNQLNLGLLLDVPSKSASYEMIKEVFLKAQILGLTIRFQPITEEEYASWVNEQAKSRYIVTLLGRTITAQHIAKVSGVIEHHRLNIDIIERLSGRASLNERSEDQRASVEFLVSGELEDALGLRAAFMAITHEFEIDIAFQADSMYRRNRRLVVFDMDSTLIRIEVIDELAKARGVGTEVVAITEAAMRGELDFAQSFTKRLSLLHGLEEEKVKAIGDSLPLTDGAERLIATLKKLGYKTAIVSGGFTYFGRILQQRLGIDYVFANELEIVDGRVTGAVRGTIVDGNRKAALLKEIAAKEQISLEQVIAVGDGANDLPMLHLAGLGIAFNAKPIVRQTAKQAISTLGLDGILYLIGVRDREIV